ncbi:MAG: FAD-binding oxidoreductase [Deltaproteobacteria bacterium]|jgi:glycine/D-amino acid oxidase-like deaminating enzyme|nr:FAD-binding oxidoreductase [Deltaproteobacteria bacterium]
MGKRYDRLIIGAGIYGLYSALALARRGLSVAVLDCDEAPFLRGSYVNQARIHNGYHYPRSISTAAKSARYFERFLEDFEDCVFLDFEQIYAVARHFSWTNGAQFARFCANVGIRCDEITDIGRYFNPSAVEKAFRTREFSFDGRLIGKRMRAEAEGSGVEIVCGADVAGIAPDGGDYRLELASGEAYLAPWVLNASYAGINQVHALAGFEPLGIKYELCEIAVCRVSESIRDVGLTVMDGPFFSVMPFGRSGLHSLTTVSRTPHATSHDPLPSFPCQQGNPECTPERTRNCNACRSRPASAFTAMRQTARKYLGPGIEIEHVESLFTLKPILKASEIDDSRPTLVRRYSETPAFFSVFSGKINTIYDLDPILT